MTKPLDNDLFLCVKHIDFPSTVLHTFALKLLRCFPEEMVARQTASLQRRWWREVYGIFLMPPHFTSMQRHQSSRNNMLASRSIHHRLQSPRNVDGVLHVLQVHRGKMHSRRETKLASEACFTTSLLQHTPTVLSLRFQNFV